MKKTFITILFFFICVSFLTFPVRFPDKYELTLRKLRTAFNNAPAGDTYHSTQSLKSTDNFGFGLHGELCAGVNIHFVSGHEKDLDMIASAGFSFIRMDFVWEHTERSQGIYDWTVYDVLAGNLKQRGLSAIFILDYSNPLYEDTVEYIHLDTGVGGQGISAPEHPGSIAAFARWSAAAALHFKDCPIIWEIWNEPNVSHFWKPKPDVAQYNLLAMATAKAIKEVVPDAMVIGPATSKVPLSFLESFLASGILEYLDAVSIHPYRDYSSPPETAVVEYQMLRELIDRYAPEGKKKLPIISSEWGYASATKGISLETQAEFIVRMQLANLLYGIPVSIWYDWKNDGDDSGNFEHNCGTVTSDLKPKAAYKAIQTMNKQLEGFTLSHRINLENEHDYVMIFRNGDGNAKISAWTTGLPHDITVIDNLSSNINVRVTDGYGNVLILKTEQGRLNLNLDTLPKYILLPQGNR